jgi:hypothetical protein
MTVKRILRVYYDLPHYMKPKEVSKVFKLMKERADLLERKEWAFGKKESERIADRLTLVGNDLELICNVIAPKGANWTIKRHTAAVGKDNILTKFFVLTITEPVVESIFDKGQDDE